MSQSTLDLSRAVLENVRAAVGAECFQTWFKELSVVEVTETTLRLAVPNRNVRDWLDNHYRKELHRAVATLLPGVTTVELISRRPDTINPPVLKLGEALAKTAASPVGPPRRMLEPRSIIAASECAGLPLAPKLRLESFGVGRCNRVAHAAAQSVAETPGLVYNPLFIYGGHGLGKTHLLQGIAHLLQERVPPQRVLHTSCEEFTNAYISAVQNKRLDQFRARVRQCDALLLDDVHFLEGRDRTQEEFLHTFDALRNANKQIVLTADAAPRDLKRLDAKLVSRFQTGLVTRLDTPDFDLRVQLLQNKARERGLQLAPDVAALLATHIEGSVGGLEGAVCKVMALAAAEQRAPDRELAMVALRELGYLKSGPVTLQDIITIVGEHFHIGADDMRSGRRHAALVHARHIAMYLSKVLTSQSVSDIGRFYGNRDHATVLHASRKLAELMKRDENIRREVEYLRQILGAR